MVWGYCARLSPRSLVLCLSGQTSAVELISMSKQAAWIHGAAGWKLVTNLCWFRSEKKHKSEVLVLHGHVAIPLCLPWVRLGLC